MKSAEEQIVDAAAALSSAMAVAAFGAAALLSFALSRSPSRDRSTRFNAPPPPSIHPQRNSLPPLRLPQYRRR